MQEKKSRTKPWVNSGLVKYKQLKNNIKKEYLVK